MRLRAHHLLCSQSFKGLGYSQEFVENFWAVLDSIRSDPQLMVEIVNQPDVICAYCPHLQDGACHKNGPESEQQVSGLDTLAIGYLGIGAGETLAIEDVFGLVKARLGPEERQDICAGCEWNEHCLKRGEQT